MFEQLFGTAARKVRTFALGAVLLVSLAAPIASTASASLGAAVGAHTTQITNIMRPHPECGGGNLPC